LRWCSLSSSSQAVAVTAFFLLSLQRISDRYCSMREFDRGHGRP
jgi:hypothetical protein